MIEVFKQALEALEYTTNLSRFLLKDEANIGPMLKADEAITSLRQAIAELESQEPVAVWELFEDGWDSIADPEWMESLPIGTKLYTHPPQRKPLTDEERRKLMSEALNKWLSRKDDGRLFAWYFSFEVEAAHGIKE